MSSREHDSSSPQKVTADRNEVQAPQPSHNDFSRDGVTRFAGKAKPDSDVELFPVAARYQQIGDSISGGMGVVFKALDTNLDIDVAIKRIRPEFAANTELITRFEREAKTQVRLRHANLVAVRDYARDDIGPYIVMDWIEGRSLAQALKAEGPLRMAACGHHHQQGCRCVTSRPRRRHYSP